MKKIYKSPVITIVKVGPILMTETSIGISSTHYDGSTIIESRRGDFWDDEDDYDE